MSRQHNARYWFEKSSKNGTDKVWVPRVGF